MSAVLNPICPWCGEEVTLLDFAVTRDGEKFHVPCAAEELDHTYFDSDMGSSG